MSDEIRELLLADINGEPSGYGHTDRRVELATQLLNAAPIGSEGDWGGWGYTKNSDGTWFMEGDDDEGIPVRPAESSCAVVLAWCCMDTAHWPHPAAIHDGRRRTEADGTCDACTFELDSR